MDSEEIVGGEVDGEGEEWEDSSHGDDGEDDEGGDDDVEGEGSVGEECDAGVSEGETEWEGEERGHEENNVGVRTAVVVSSEEAKPLEEEVEVEVAEAEEEAVGGEEGKDAMTSSPAE